jgi:hypothetical protein
VNARRPWLDGCQGRSPEIRRMDSFPHCKLRGRFFTEQFAK